MKTLKTELFRAILNDLALKLLWIELSFFESTKNTFSWKDLFMHITKELDIKFRQHIIQQLLKKRFFKSYKKVPHWLSKIDNSKHKWIKELFRTNLLSALSSVRIIVIDGCCL